MIDPCSHLIRAWVDPVFGVDGIFVAGPGGGPNIFSPQVNDPDAPFKTIQRAIDALENHLISAFNAGDQQVQGLVYSIPGMYGPTGNGEVLPIVMRDRVHVQGQGARGCVIRGFPLTGSFNQTPFILPVLPGAPNPPTPKGLVLVDYSKSSRFSKNFVPSLPWQAFEETSEMLDGFTFQGGEVQVLFFGDNSTQVAGDPELRGRISNCLFDMRNDWPVTSDVNGVRVPGPYFGIQLAKRPSAGGNTSCPFVGYPDQKVLIANNTFIFCELGMLQNQIEVVTSSRMEAVGIIDVTEPCPISLGWPVGDPDNTRRGVGKAMIVNNLFRTTPDIGGNPQFKPFAMLGIDSNDTIVGTSFSPPRASNAFASDRVGNVGNGFTNGMFISTQVSSHSIGFGVFIPDPLWDCHSTPTPACGSCNAPPCCATPASVAPCAAAPLPPQAIVDIFHGCSSPPCVSIGVDPLFVGEFLAPGFTSPPSRYRDWRLLPGSPLIDLGVRPEVALQSSPLPTMHTSLPSGWTYSEPACSELQSFDWDHEGFGNPRISGPAPDIGFDEFQMFIMAGNYANDSNSHNLSGFMNPTVEAGRANRVMLFPLGVGGANLVRINGVYAVQAPFPPAPAPPPAWQQPPRTNRVINPLLPLGFQTRYISFSNSSTSSSPPMGVAMPWDSAAGGPTVVNYFVPWNTPQGSIGFRKFIVPDGEISTGYFGAQAVIHAGDPIGSPTLWSNLQFEYR